METGVATRGDWAGVRRADPKLLGVGCHFAIRHSQEVVERGADGDGDVHCVGLEEMMHGFGKSDTQQANHHAGFDWGVGALLLST